MNHRPVLLVIAAIFATSCFLSNGEGSDSDGAEPVVEPLYDCERDGFPCTFGEMDPAVHQLGSDLLGEARQRLGEGQSMSQVADWLRGRDGIASVHSNDVTIMYRPEEGRPFILHDAVAASGLGDTMTQELRPAEPRPRVRRSPLESRDRTQSVVGSDRDGDGHRDFKKKALVLEAFEWQLEDGFTVRGDDLIAAAEETFDYRGGIEYRTNEDVRLVDFRRFDEFDLVYVGSHGGVVGARAWGRSSFIMTGHEIDDCSRPELKEYATEFGVACAALNVDGWLNTSHEALAVTERFFRQSYDGGVDDTIILLDNCKSGRQVSEDKGKDRIVSSNLMATSLIGERTAVFGWTENVEVHFAEESLQTFFTDLITHGVHAREARAALCDAGKCVDDAEGAEWVLYQRPGTDVRAVEMLQLFMIEQDPPRQVGSGLDLPAITVGTVGDTIQDSFAFVPQLRGVVDPDGWTWTVDARVNGEDLFDSPFQLSGPAAATKVAPYTYRSQVPAVVPIQEDLQSGEPYDVQFRVTMPHHQPDRPRPSLSPRFEHSFGTCSVEMELSGEHTGSYIGTSAEYDVPTNTILLMGLSEENEPAWVTAELDDDDELAAVRLNAGSGQISWEPSDDGTASLDLGESGGIVSGTLNVEFQRGGETTELTATFEALRDEDGEATGCSL